MKTRALNRLLLALCLLLPLGAKALADESAPRTDVVYTCDCGKDCKCSSVSLKPGNCSCGKPMRWHHVIKTEGDDAILCNCDTGCKCALSKDDPAKCGCGNDVTRVSLKGTGIYFCNCKGSCKCNTLSDKADECRCGMKLHKVDK